MGNDNAEDGSCASALKALDGELIGIPPGAVALLPSATTSHAVTHDDCDSLPSSHPFQSDYAQAIPNVATEQSVADAAPALPKIDKTHERRTVSRNVSPHPPGNIGHVVAVESNSSAASNGTILSESDHRPEDTNPCNPLDSGALEADPKDTSAEAGEANDRLTTDGIAKDVLGKVNSQHSSTFTTCPHPEAAVDKLEACESQWNGQQPREVGHDSPSHSSTVSMVFSFTSLLSHGTDYCPSR
jgi:hypothetical protein